MKLFSNLVVAVLVATLAACGGGGGGGDSGGSPSPTPASITCPDGSSATSAATCPTVAASGGAQSALDGTTVSFSGTLASATGVLWKGAVDGTPVAGTSSLATDMKTVKFTPTVRLAHGQTYTFVVTGIDSVGRTVQTTTTFVHGPMVCANNAVWSNPAAYVPAYDACVAPLGVQTLMNSAANTMTDTSCVFVVGQPMSATCKAYAANGTLMFANTGVTVGGKATVLVVYYAQGGQSQLALLDATTLSVINTIGFSNQLVWINGNPTGAAIATNVGGKERREQMTYNGSTFVFACYAGC